MHKYIFSWNIFLQVEFPDESIAIFMIFDKLFSPQKSYNKLHLLVIYLSLLSSITSIKYYFLRNIGLSSQKLLVHFLNLQVKLNLFLFITLATWIFFFFENYLLVKIFMVPGVLNHSQLYMEWHFVQVICWQWHMEVSRTKSLLYSQEVQLTSGMMNSFHLKC